MLVEDSPNRYEFAPDCHVIRKRRGYTIARGKITTNQEMISKPSGWNYGALVGEETACPFEPRTGELIAVDLQRSIDRRNRRGQNSDPIPSTEIVAKFTSPKTPVGLTP